MSASGLPARPFLYPIVDVATVGEASVVRTVERLVAAGVSLVQLRAKTIADRALVALAQAAVEAAHRGGARLVVNDRADVARLVGADGVHVGQDDLPPAEARALLGAGAIVGFSTHDLTQLQRAAHEPVDYIALGPVFATSSKENPDPVIGTDLLRLARRWVAVPLVAIGGISRANVREVVAAGADGVAVISDLLRADDLEVAVREYQRALRA